MTGVFQVVSHLCFSDFIQHISFSSWGPRNLEQVKRQGSERGKKGRRQKIR